MRDIPDSDLVPKAGYPVTISLSTTNSLYILQKGINHKQRDI